MTKRVVRQDAQANMAEEEKPVFSLSDIRALRWLAIVVGLVACGLFALTGGNAPVLVAGFCTVVMGAVVVVIFLLRRVARKNLPAANPPGPPSRS